MRHSITMTEFTVLVPSAFVEALDGGEDSIETCIMDALQERLPTGPAGILFGHEAEVCLRERRRMPRNSGKGAKVIPLRQGQG